MKQDVLRNKVDGTEHDNLEKAFNYYSIDLLESGYELGISENGVHTIQNLSELCDVLNSLNIYDCGSSFEIIRKEF